MTSSSLVGSILVSRRPAVRDAVLLLALAWLVPFLVHLVPWSGARPLGVHVLPMFWVTFVAVYFYGGLMGAAAGLVAPLVNLIVTGLPAGKYVTQSAVELVVFAFVSAWVLRRTPRLFLVAPLGYVAARAVWVLATVVADPVVRSGGVASALEPMVRTFTNGAAGLLVLTAINVALTRFFPTEAAKPATPES